MQSWLQRCEAVVLEHVQELASMSSITELARCRRELDRDRQERLIMRPNIPSVRESA